MEVTEKSSHRNHVVMLSQFEQHEVQNVQTWQPFCVHSFFLCSEECLINCVTVAGCFDIYFLAICFENVNHKIERFSKIATWVQLENKYVHNKVLFDTFFNKWSHFILAVCP